MRLSILNRIALITAIALIGLIIPSVSPVNAQALGSDYVWNYEATNIYDDQALHYEFTDLEDTVNYIFTLESLSYDNVTTGVIATCTPIRDLTLDTGTLFAYLTNTGSSDYCNAPQNYSFGPFRVTDQFGQVLGTHFVAPAPFQPDWETTGYNNAFEKQVVGKSQIPPQDANGLASDPLMLRSVVNRLDTRNAWTLLHYRVDITDYIASDVDRFILVYDMNGDFHYTYSLQDFVAYNRREIGGSPISLSSEDYQSFIVLNTLGNDLPFINKAQNTFAFSASSFDNPMESTLPIGVYEYFRVDGNPDPATSFQSIGESLLFVSSESEFYHVQITKNVLAPSRQVALRYYIRDCTVALQIPISTITDLGQALTVESGEETSCIRSRFITWTGNSVDSSNTVVASRDILSSIIQSDGYDVLFDFTVWQVFQRTGYTIQTITPVNTIDTATDFFDALGLRSDVGTIVMFTIGIVAIMSLIGGISIFLSTPVPPFIYYLGYLAVGGMMIVLDFQTLLFYTLFGMGILAGAFMVWSQKQNA